MPQAIRTEALHKVYPGYMETPALQALTLDIAAGEIVVVLGPNGAGKTTLFKILATLVKPTSGQAWVAGFSINQTRDVRARIGMLSDPDRSFFWRLNARQNLEFFARGYGLKGQEQDTRVREMLELLDLVELAGKPVGQLSSGQRGRLALARSLLHSPSILILDEPTRSLDPAAAKNFLSLLQRYRSEGNSTTILLSTHRLGAVAPFCERVLFLKGGRLQAQGSPEYLLARAGLVATASSADNLTALYHHYVDQELGNAI